VLPLISPLRPLHVVYFAPGAEAPTPEALAQAAASWSDANLKPPLRDAAIAYREKLLAIELIQADRLPPPPLPILQYMGMGELDERILQSATQVAVISGPDLNAKPYIGFWAVLAAALGVRELLQGTLFDPQALRIINPEKAPSWFTADGRIAVMNHIQVPFSIQERGLGWMTTRGLEKFGLPELELRDVPPNLQKLTGLMNGAAQFLVEQAAQQGQTGTELSLPAEIALDQAVFERAHAKPASDQPRRMTPQAVGLRFDPKERLAHPPMVQIVKPRKFSGDTGMWLNEILGHLLGSERDMRMVRTSDDAMQAAHERAVSELPAVKQRFLGGLKPGETLFLKHGFTTSTGDKEYIWVVVNRWDGDEVTAQVANDPNDVPGLRLGMTVKISEADVFDWTILLPDGRKEGDYTTQVVLAEGQQPAAG
jgi:uncharacterized protein YegJ (DUF2314 family)